MVHGAWYEMRMTEKSMKTNTDLTLLSVCCCTLFLALRSTHLRNNPTISKSDDYNKIL